MNKTCFKTRLALLWMNLSNEPLAAMYSLFPFILCKDLGATTYQITLFIMLRPVLSVFSSYWSASHRKLLPNLIGAWVLARIPFLVFPFFKHFWYLLFACGVYQLFSRAATPALMELLKRNMSKELRERVFSLYYVLGFVESVILGLVMGGLLDIQGESWKWLLVASALIGLSSVFVQMRIPASEETPVKWSVKESLQLLKSRPDFGRFQWGFMMGGFALMLMAPALSIFYVHTLELTHASVAVARFVFMGLGVVGSSILWKQGLEQRSINQLMVWVLLGFALFPLLLFGAMWEGAFLYVAFLLYGVAQAGSHLIWNLSGTIFSGESESTPYTTVNVLMVGVRGAVGPILGGVLCELAGPIPVLVLGALLAAYGAWYMSARVSQVLANEGNVDR